MADVIDPGASAAPAAAPAAAAPVESAASTLYDASDKPAEATNVESDPTAADPLAGAEPAAYELALPEGLELPDGVLEGVKAVLANANVSPDQAQALFDKYVEGIGQATDRTRQAGADAWADQQKQWRAEVARDPEIGGAKQQLVIADIRRGADVLLGTKQSSEFYAALDFTGAGNNPAVIRALNRAFAIHAPAKTVTGGPASAKDTRTAGGTLYPKQGDQQ